MIKEKLNHCRTKLIKERAYKCILQVETLMISKNIESSRLFEMDPKKIACIHSEHNLASATRNKERMINPINRRK